MSITPEENLTDAIRKLVADAVEWQANAIDEVCRVAALDGRYGVLVTGAGVSISKDVPAFNIYYDWSNRAGVQLYEHSTELVSEWTVDPRIPE